MLHSIDYFTSWPIIITDRLCFWSVVFVPVGDEWYLCRLTLTLPSLSDLQWAMFPSPYLAAVGPDAAPGTLVYRLSAQRADGSQATAQFLLVEGEDALARGHGWKYSDQFNSYLGHWHCLSGSIIVTGGRETNSWC